MGIKMVDTAEPMNENGYPVARAKHIWFDDSESLQKKLDDGSLGGGGGGYTQLSQAEYDALSDDEKMNGKEYRTYDTGHIYKLGVEYGKDYRGMKSYTSLADLELDTTATINDIISKMANNSMFVYKTDVFDLSQYENLQYATVTIIKQSASRVQAIMTDKDTGILYVGKLDSTNKIVGWKKTIAENSNTDPYSCAGYKALTGTEDLFTLAPGHYVSANINTTYNYPITDTNITAHIYVLGHLNDPANNKGYRIILYFDNKGRMYRINEWWGNFSNGWQEINSNEIIHTSLSGNLAGVTTVLDLVNALVEEYRATSPKKPIRFVSGEITKTTLTDLPRNYGLLQITVFGYDVVEVSFAGSSFGFKTLHYGFVNRTSGEALFSSLFWEIVDTPVTELIDLGLDGSATIQNVMDAMTIGQHCILNTSRFDDKTQVDNIEYGKVEIRRLSSGMWSLWLEDVLHGNTVAHGTCSNSKFAGWHYFVTKEYVDSKIADLQAQIDALK